MILKINTEKLKTSHFEWKLIHIKINLNKLSVTFDFAANERISGNRKCFANLLFTWSLNLKPSKRRGFALFFGHSVKQFDVNVPPQSLSSLRSEFASHRDKWKVTTVVQINGISPNSCHKIPLIFAVHVASP